MNRTPRTKDLPDFEPLDRDEFLGQVESVMSSQSFSERIDPFSGTLHLNMVDVVLPGNAGLDIVIQRYYSSNVVNRVDNTLLTRHAASADISGRLGDSGWQLHMGKLMNPFPGPDSHTTLIMPDGSTHALYNRDGFPGQKITQEGWLYNVSGSVHTVRTTTGLTYIFDAAFEAAQYTYLGIDNGSSIQVIQTTRIEDLNGNAINIEYYWFPGAVSLASLIKQVSFDDPADLRRVEFSYHESSWLLKELKVVEDTDVLQTWGYSYGAPTAQVPQPQHPSVGVRTVNSLTAVYPPEGNPWIFEYYDLSTDWEAGKWLMKTVQSPRASRATYTWGPEFFDTGAQACSEVPEFLAVQTRQTSFHTGVGDLYEDEATTVYTYTNGGQEDATTDIVSTDSQTGVVLATQEYIFHGWGPYALYDPDLWKVGLTKSSTVTTMDDLGGALETMTTTNVWEQGGVISQDIRKTSPWVACGGFRQLSPVSYARPNSVTRVVERHDSIPDPPPVPLPDPASYTTISTTFDNWGNVGLIEESSSDGLIRTTTLTYWQDAANNIMVGRVQGRDPDPGGSQCRQYDSLGRLSSSFTNPATDDVAECSPTEPAVGARRVDFTYNAQGNLETQTETSTPHDRVTTHTDYQYGSPRDTIVTTGNGEDIHYCREYEPLGMVSWETDGRGCDTAYQTAYAYDTFGRLESSDPPLSDPTTFAYFQDWTQVTVTRGGQEFIYGFDRFGKLTDIFNSQTSHWTQITNDALGRRRQIDMLWNPEPGDTVTYDPLGRLTAVIHPDTDPNTQITVTYEGSTVTGEDENGHTTQYLYEAFGDPSDRRLASLVDAASNTTTYGYDPAYGLLDSVTAPIPQGNRSFEYFSGTTDCDNGFLERETHPESGETTYEYNCLGAITKRTRPGPEITTYGYDYAGRLTDIFYPDDAGTVTMGYDQASRRTSLVNDSATSVSFYDDAGRLETVTQSIVGGLNGSVTTYGYDTLDRLQTITYPSGRIVTYGWDNRNWLESVTGEEGSGVSYLPSISYHNTGAMDLVSFANGVSTDHAIDDRNRLSGLVTTGPGGSLMNSTLGYDFASNLTTWTDNLPSNRDRSFGYDSLDRLTSATAPGMWGTLVFTYDELGNRTSKTLGGTTTTYPYDGSKNRLTSLTGAEQSTFSYDDIGRLIGETRVLPEAIFADAFESGDTSAWSSTMAKSTPMVTQNWVYTFNAADQLTQAAHHGQVVGDYVYDGDNLRVAKTVGDVTVYYLRDPQGNTLAEYDQDDTFFAIAEYIYVNGRQIAKVVRDGDGADDFRFFHADQLGSALVITDDEGASVWTGDYLPFGGEDSSEGEVDRYRFTQHELDNQTGFLYAKARFYDPRIGRFISTDPVGGSVGNSQSWNRYAYVGNNPLAFIDPDGERQNPVTGKRGVDPPAYGVFGAIRLDPGNHRIGQYGWTRRDSSGKPKEHKGIDINSPTGTPIRSAEGGTISRISFGPDGGHRIDVETTAGEKIVLVHLDRITPGFKVGDAVSEGDVIGLSGTTGNQASPGDKDYDPKQEHVHMTVFNSKGVRTDPEAWLNDPSAPPPAPGTP